MRGTEWSPRLLATSSVGQKRNRTRPVLLSPLDFLMSTWKPDSDSLKWYPHFDQPLPLEEILAIIGDPRRVASNAFFPFISYDIVWQPFRKTGQPKVKKSRAIRYASRRDSYIFSAYRHILSEKYERLLKNRELEDRVIAYRKIPSEDGRGKCNIHFARDAFDAIGRIGNCCAVALDISKFFESIDHEALRERWCALIGLPRLPPDHYTVFKAITKYAVVDRKEVYKRLAYYGPKKNGVEGFLLPFYKMPKQLCSPKHFRLKIAGSAKYSRLIQKNDHPFGIPQGAPISDLLANLYLLDFDHVMRNYATSRGGVYYRYSDDILIVLPGDGRAGQGARAFAKHQIEKLGPGLKIKPQKTLSVKFVRDDDAQNYECMGDQRKNGLEYLGFRFDGKRILS